MSTAHLSPVTDLLFVYGTLMQGFANPYARQLQRQSRFIGPGRLPGRLYRVSWFPGAVPDSTVSSFIFGEVYQLHNPVTTLEFLDEYEEVTPDGTGLYVRQLWPVDVGEQFLTCWVYTYNASTAKLVPIESGRWKN